MLYDILVPYTSLFRSVVAGGADQHAARAAGHLRDQGRTRLVRLAYGFELLAPQIGRPERLDHEERHRRLRRSEEHTSELQSPCNLVCRLLLEKHIYM